MPKRQEKGVGRLSLIERYAKRKARSLSATSGCEIVICKAGQTFEEMQPRCNNAVVILNNEISFTSADLNTINRSNVTAQFIEFSDDLHKTLNTAPGKIPTHLKVHLSNEGDHHTRFFISLFYFLAGGDPSLGNLQITKGHTQNKSLIDEKGRISKKTFKSFVKALNLFGIQVKPLMKHLKVVDRFARKHQLKSDCQMKSDGAFITIYSRITGNHGQDLMPLKLMLSKSKLFGTVVNIISDQEIEILGFRPSSNFAKSSNSVFAVFQDLDLSLLRIGQSSSDEREAS